MGILRLATGLLLALIPGRALAYTVPSNFCAFGVSAGLSACDTGGITGMANYTAATIIQVIGVIFVAVAVAMFAYYAALFITKSNDEGTIREAKIAYAHAITGGAIVSLSAYIVTAFRPGLTGVGGTVIDIVPLETGFRNVITYIKLALALAMSVNLVVQATRIIASQEQGEIDKAKKRLLFGFIGVGFILIADAIIKAAYPPLGANASGIAIEIRGIANFLLAGFAILCVLAIIAAGIFLVISIDEQLKEKAKTLVRTAVISLAVVLAAYVLVNAFATI